MALGSLGLDSVDLEGLRRRTMQIVCNSPDQKRCLKMLRAKVASFLESGDLGFAGTAEASEGMCGCEVWPGILPPSSSAVQGGDSEAILIENAPIEDEVKGSMMASEVAKGSAAVPLAGVLDGLVPLAVFGSDGEIPLCPWRRVFKDQRGYKCARRDTGLGRISDQAALDTVSIQINKGCNILFHTDDVESGQYKGRGIVARNSARIKEKIKTEEGIACADRVSVIGKTIDPTNEKAGLRAQSREQK